MSFFKEREGERGSIEEGRFCSLISSSLEPMIQPAGMPLKRSPHTHTHWFRVVVVLTAPGLGHCYGDSAAAALPRRGRGTVAVHCSVLPCKPWCCVVRLTKQVQYDVCRYFLCVRESVLVCVCVCICVLLSE